MKTNASDAQIKKAYYQQALKYHPDKNQSEAAKERFQKIGEAYQILGNPQSREIYDTRGLDGVQDLPQFDS